MATPDDPSEMQEQEIKTIMVVEDDPDIGEFITKALEIEPSYQVLHVVDASAALEAVKTITPDFFLLDYQLPGINGLELADRFQESEALKHIPMLLMSANILEQELEERDITFLPKPFEVNELIQTIANLLTS